MNKYGFLGKIKKFIVSIGILLLISLIGEGLHAYIPLPIPASVYGLMILFFALVAKVIRLDWIESGADILIAIMPMLFVPSVVKLVGMKSLIMDNIVPLLSIIIISSVVVMVVTGKVSQKCMEREDDDAK